MTEASHETGQPENKTKKQGATLEDRNSALEQRQQAAGADSR
jgi:hypothetical protein